MPAAYREPVTLYCLYPEPKAELPKPFFDRIHGPSACGRSHETIRRMGSGRFLQGSSKQTGGLRLVRARLLGRTIRPQYGRAVLRARTIRPFIGRALLRARTIRPFIG